MAADEAKATTEDTVEVEILDQVYRVRGRDDRTYLQDLAALVDSTMREVAENSKTVDRAKIAILAALNIADELKQSQDRQEGDPDDVERRVTALTGELTAALSR